MDVKTDTKPTAKNLNKPAYIIFILTGIYFIIRGDFSQATIFWGLALVFDPFNPAMPFPKRPFYQKAWLFIHLAFTIALFVVMIWRK